MARAVGAFSQERVMSQATKKHGEPRIENIELSKETLEDLSEADASEVRGGRWVIKTSAPDGCPPVVSFGCPQKAP